MRTVLMDTVGLLAIWEETDQWHTDAVRAFGTLDPRTTRFVSTSLIMLECGNAASRKPYRRDVDALRRAFALDSRLVAPTDADMESAWIDYVRGKVGDAGIVDHVTFAIMRRLQIEDAFTNDRHFKIAGFNTLF